MNKKKKSTGPGKGDKRRPGDDRAYDENYDRIFGKTLTGCDCLLPHFKETDNGITRLKKFKERDMCRCQG